MVDKKGSWSSRISVFLIVIAFGVCGVACQLNAVSPQPRHGAKMVYDYKGTQVILFGGRGNGGIIGDLYNDLWALDLDSQRWKKLDVASGPTPRLSPGLVYDPVHHQLILFGGYSNQGRVNDTWLFDLTNLEWEELQTGVSPPARSDMGMAYEVSNQVVVLFGGYCLEHQRDYCDDTWIYDPSDQNWYEMNPPASPPVMYGHSLDYDTQNQQFLLWGGHMSDLVRGGGASAGYNDSIWSYRYSDNQWLEITPGSQSHPVKRYWHQAAYDSSHQGLLVFGGDSGQGYKNDGWFYDPATENWTRLITDLAPPARIVGAMVDCPDYDEVVLFGGLDNDFSNLDDTWIYSNISGEWEEISR